MFVLYMSGSQCEAYVQEKGRSLLLPELISDHDINRRFHIHLGQLLKCILRNIPPPNAHPRSPTPMSIHLTADHIINDKISEYRKPGFEGYGEGDVVKDSEAGGHVGYLTVGGGQTDKRVVTLLFAAVNYMSSKDILG
jgi:hypothetical protein